MTAVQELKVCLEALPDGEDIAAAVLAWIKEQKWDRQIEADAIAGRLDHLIEEVKKHHQAGRTTPLSS